ncbi:uncharacterized protein LOC110435511 isoform X2 [Sorghum bicolor]|uniref:uncharacterized protein LOC110435511 isoform X2 n=1 Tax=Sorghum bicolor TaxID=4558 RepID=UPI000B424EA2|nr:uncharacterized protein LOC110435511 isoform X2 [Sorghum bicolor]|eukprot:XP_021316800.1 uncharacterized protein LOC110435511 isoform X2 [Sorghum bicolor]
MPASKSSDSALRQVPKPAISSPPTGAKSSGSQASGSAPRQAPKAGDSAPRRRAKPATLPPPTGAKTKGLNQGDEEDDCFVVEEDGTLIYTRFCSKRAASLLNKKELCHICYFKHGRVNPFKKTEGKKGGYLCKKKGCCITTSSRKEAGRHHYFCHEKYRDWWVECLKLHGEMPRSRL